MTNIDCIAESLQPEVFDADDRVFTVSYATRYVDDSRIPAFIMKGLWLNEAGFSTGTKVDVKMMKGCMILMSRESEPEIETLMDAVLARNADKAGELIYQHLLSPIPIIKGAMGKVWR